MGKKISIPVILLSAVVTVMGQERTLVRGPVDHGGFGGPSLVFTAVNGELGMMNGGRGGWILDHVFFLGGAGYELSNEIPAQEDVSGRARYLEFGYGGVDIGFILASDRLVHVTLHTLLGGGGLDYLYHWPPSEDGEYTDDVDVIFVLAPTIDAELNVTRFCRLTAGASYRYVADVELPGLTNEDLRGFSVELAMKFGKF